MRLARTLTVAAFLALSATACTASGEPPTREGQAPPPPRGDSGCSPTRIDAAELAPDAGGWLVTAVRRVMPKAADEPPPAEVDQPFAPWVDWKSARVDEDAAVAIIEDSLGHPASGTSATLADLDRVLSGVTESRTHVGFTAVKVFSVPLTATCRDGSTV
ncbi:hypothetical protein [Micromonospora sp. WMMD1082]|uniref:hypothetical protein n=1 Tax=Micromonospora sp. WMMD1082 TaxID=3016104 RepID=UPI00241712CC|nr:hypothetical protein [Micromonospora sp. WMMD1082]MDG4795814.1 hypothetical protein [Micromonospora sp. WMMD1082]